ncbi:MULTISPECIES: acyltransferase family protein [Aequorivita]|uniref:Acyltransferase n=1 Tax=Aequorivita iocasae TaxID=2803865 RepID=A0ABX7DSR3_9FLAO|nr:MULTISPECIES: acyltransferase [Aequorivita]QQX76792.1 acyltransferase [Aequorivita iocasae]UCA56264.1 acyltransferase [Aequorivita sp. F7]
MFGILRTLLAINVVLLHIFNVPTLGNYSVSFFFLLSGFLMTLIMHETYGYSFKGFNFFWLNRILRLYPTYLIILVVTIIAIIIFPQLIRHPDLFMPKGGIEWIANITMIYPNVVPHRIEPRLVPPSWALTNELFFYCLISFGISKTFKRTFIWLTLSVLYFIGTYYFYNIATYRYSAIFASSLPFAMGASLYWITKTRTLINVRLFTILLVYILFVLNALFGHRYGFFLKELAIYFNMLIAFVLVYLLYTFKINQRIKKIDSYLGYYSYPIYLSHYLIAIFYSGIIGYGLIEGSFKLKMTAIIPYSLVLLLFCFFIVHLIDKNIDAYKRKLKKQELKK